MALTCFDLQKPLKSGNEEQTLNLLNFMDIATSNIKQALDKTSKFKRKVNHRKYLQKQLKRRCYASSIAASTGSFKNGHSVASNSSSSSSNSRRKDTSQSELQTKSLNALFDIRHHNGSSQLPLCVGSTSSTSPTLQNRKAAKTRKLPASFFVEPALRDANCRCNNITSLQNDCAITEVNNTRFPTNDNNNINTNSFNTFCDSDNTNLSHSFLQDLEYSNSLSDFSSHQASNLSSVEYLSYAPAENLDSILRQVDINDIIGASEFWREDENAFSQSSMGSNGTASPRSLSDASDFTASTPSPNSSYNDVKSPSWSPWQRPNFDPFSHTSFTSDCIEGSPSTPITYQNLIQEFGSCPNLDQASTKNVNNDNFLYNPSSNLGSSWSDFSQCSQFTHSSILDSQNSVANQNNKNTNSHSQHNEMMYINHHKQTFIHQSPSPNTTQAFYTTQQNTSTNNEVVNMQAFQQTHCTPTFQHLFPTDNDMLTNSTSDHTKQFRISDILDSLNTTPAQTRTSSAPEFPALLAFPLAFSSPITENTTC